MFPSEILRQPIFSSASRLLRNFGRNSRFPLFKTTILTSGVHPSTGSEIDIGHKVGCLVAFRISPVFGSWSAIWGSRGLVFLRI